MGLTALFFAACQANSPPVMYYSLLDTDSPHRQVQQSNGLILSIGPVLISDMLKQPRIATGGARGQYQLSEYNRWIGELDHEIGRAVAENLSAILGTEQVAVFPWDQHLNVTCRVHLEVLAMDGDLGAEAKLVVRWSLIIPKGQTPETLSRRSELKEQTEDGSYASWVNAQQHNIRRLSDAIAASIRENIYP
ncbi:MAG: PqiC family protein [Pseudomonadota bacterium]